MSVHKLAWSAAAARVYCCWF